MAMPLQHQPHPVPLDLNRALPDPALPLKISERVFGQMRVQEAAPYKKVQVLPTDPEWRLVWRLFHHDKPHRYGIGRIFCVYERDQQQVFEKSLSSIEREAATFPPTWNLEPFAAERAIVIDRWKEIAQIFSPFQTMESDGRKRTWTQTKVLLLWHGSEAGCDSICKSGFTFFGKTSIGLAGGPKSTNEGLFGSGFYFTNSGRYAADIYGQGVLVGAWVSMREPFPAVGDSKQTDMHVLKGKGAYKDYNAHYVPVSSVDPSNPYEAIYFPTQKGQDIHCDEIVVFQESQALPRFWVELTVETPYLMSPTDIPQFVNELIPHLLKLLQNPYVDRDQKLRNCLGRELGFLLTLQEDDDLEERHETFYQQLTQLIDTQGKVDKKVRGVLTGTHTASTHAPSFLLPAPSLTSATQPLAVSKPAPAAPLPLPVAAPVVPSPAPLPAPAPKTNLPPATSVAVAVQPSLVTMPAMAFGKEMWAKYFGDIEVEPPLPSDIEQILNSPCIFWPWRKVRDTHLLVLVPQTVNGRTFCLDSLAELIQNPRTGFRTQYRHYDSNIKKDLGAKSYPSHWVLMMRDVIEGSRNKTYDAQQALVASHAQKSKIPYEMPTILDATTAILMHYVETGEALYTDNKLGDQWTYTCCQEKVCNNQWRVAIGGFSVYGLGVGNFHFGDYGGLGCCRKF